MNKFLLFFSLLFALCYGQVNAYAWGANTYPNAQNYGMAANYQGGAVAAGGGYNPPVYGPRPPNSNQNQNQNPGCNCGTPQPPYNTQIPGLPPQSVTGYYPPNANPYGNPTGAGGFYRT